MLVASFYQVNTKKKIILGVESTWKREKQREATVTEEHP